MNNKHYIGKRVSTFEAYNSIGPISGIALLLDDQNEIFAGSDEGYILEVSCPYGTQTMANSLLEQLEGKTYQGYRSDAAELPFSAELGDGISVNGIYSMLAYRNVTFGPGHFSEIAAPSTNELEHEYPYLSREQRQIERKIATTQSLITKTSEEIQLEIIGLENEQASLSLSLDGLETRITGAEDELASMTLTLDGFQTQINGKIDGNEAQTLIDQSIDQISLSVSSANGSTTFTLKDGETTLDTQTLNLTVEAVNITGMLNANQINMTGAITWSDLSSGVQSDINDAVDTADTAYSLARTANTTASDLDDIITEWKYVKNGTTYIDGGMIMVGTIIVDELYGDTIYLYDDAGKTAGTISTTGATSTSNRKIVIDSGAIELTTSDGDIFMESGSGEYLHIQSGGDIVCGLADFVPNNNATWNLGNTRKYWDTVYCSTCEGTTSDRDKKNSIIYGLDAYDALFDGLRPISYRLNSGKSGRRHMGLCAQDVEQLLAECGISTLDCAALIKSQRADDKGNEIEGEYDYALRYGEFISLLIEQVQKLKTRVARLEGAA